MCPHGVHIHDMDSSGHLVDQDKWTNTTKELLQFWWQDNKVISTDWGKLQDICELVLV